MNSSESASRHGATAFSLLEVVIAIGIFATGVVTLISLFGVLAKSVAANSEFSVAANLSDALQIYLASDIERAGSLVPVRELLAAADRTDGVLFASRDGLRVGRAGDPTWTGRAFEQFFEIRLVTPLAPLPAANEDHLLCYVAEVRWPARGGRDEGEAGFSPQVVHLPGSMTR